MKNISLFLNVIYNNYLGDKLPYWGKYQWDFIHNPQQLILSGLLAEEEGEAKVTKKGKPIAIITDTTMTEGKVFVYNGTDKKMKVKFETSDTSKTKIAFQLATLIESTNTNVTYPKTGYDTLIYNQIKEITLDSLPQGKYSLICKSGKTEYKTGFFIRKQNLEITKEQLKKVFTDTDTAILAQISKTVNTYGKAFGITTTDRMANFLAQTGYESGGFKAAKGEDYCYTSTNVNWSIWFDLTWKESPFGTNCDTSLNTCVKGSKKLKWTAITCDSTSKNCVAVPTDYICAKTNPIKGDALAKKFFSYVYQCEGGNGNSASEEGYKYRGHGAIQLTWKKSYEAFDTWLKNNYKDKYKNVVNDPTLIDSDKELFILSAMWFWNTNSLNGKADEGKFDDITKKINKDSEGKADRLKYLNNLKNEIK
jgi:predicted chitinase